MPRKPKQSPGKPTSAAEEVERASVAPSGDEGVSDEVEHEAPASVRGADVEREVIALARETEEDIESGAPFDRGWDVHPDDVESGAPGNLGWEVSPDDLE